MKNDELKNEGLKLWYKQPAKKWTEALPIGNGCLGAMVFGKIKGELIQLNEDTLWSGGPADYNNYEASQHLKEVRKLIFAGSINKANAIISEKMLGKFMQAYQPLGDLEIDDLNHGKIQDYYRDLNLHQAISSVKYIQNNTRFSRKFFATAVDHAIILHFSTESDMQTEKYHQSYGLINLRCRLKSPHISKTSIIKGSNSSTNELQMKGKLPEFVDCYGRAGKRIDYTENKGMKWETRLIVLNTNGTCIWDKKSEGVEENALIIQNASELTLALVAASSFNGFDHDPNQNGKDTSFFIEKRITQLRKKTYEKVLADHIKDYSQLFMRVELNLGRTKAASLPTDKRIKRLKRRFPLVLYYVNCFFSKLFKKQANRLGSLFEKSSDDFDDPQLIALYFQYGRYLMISSSRKGTQPANLQGIWNKKVRPPWASNYTININTEMNYWPVLSCNLSECHEPLLRLIKELSVNGQETAKIHYNCKGWCAHHNTTLWRNSTPADRNPVYAFWPLGGAWLSLNLWNHYEYTLDKDYLRDFAYPLLKEASRFCLDWLVEDAHGHLVTCPSTSPENMYLDATNDIQSVYYGSTCDLAIIRELLGYTIKATEILSIDKEFREELTESLEKIHPYQIGKYGQLQEWIEDFKEREPGHRHFSHLIALHPGTQITPRSTPDLADACRNSLLRRIAYGGGATGWSCAWKINMFSRLKDAPNTYNSICTLLRNSTYPNLFDAHPPFQIDGNFGGTAGIAEMLVQSHNNCIKFLPALPSELKDGYIKGLCIRGNAEVDIYWNDAKLERVTIRPKIGGIFQFWGVNNFTIGPYKNTEDQVNIKETDGMMQVILKKNIQYEFIRKA
ncbi:MAG: glycoside hydrolase family 95 protein [Candidatus Lokiarchaeota archaeon]|nr:glycoside hydrolase family 95 protein [Candidatus Lokiarchaeota archaeon]